MEKQWWNCLYKPALWVSLLGLCLTAPAHATAKTLPQGVWKFDLSHANYKIVKGGVNPSGDRTTWVDRDLEDVTVKDFALFTKQLNPLFENFGLTTIPENTNIVDSWKRNRIHFDVAYGINDKLTAFINLTHERAEADYNEAYEAQTAVANTQLEALGANPALAALPGLANPNITLQEELAAQAESFKAAPDKATSNHLKDTYVGLKYKIKDNLSVATRISAGFLKTGNDSTEKKNADGVLELETGNGIDEYQFFIYYDWITKWFPIHLTGGYFLHGTGTQSFLDNVDIKVDYGDILMLSAATEIPFKEKFVGELGLVHLIVGADKYKDGNSGFTSMTSVQNSAGYASIGKVGLKYMHKKFLHFFVRGTMPIKNQKDGQIYDFPGRLEPGFKLIFGTTFFFK